MILIHALLCRKCGRVVCGNCSPHRITIPQSYIVHPPNPYEPGTFAEQAPYHPNDQWEGEEVRVCNPCVPDPNLNPPTYPTLGLLQYNFGPPESPSLHWRRQHRSSHSESQLYGEAPSGFHPQHLHPTLAASSTADRPYAFIPPRDRHAFTSAVASSMPSRYGPNATQMPSQQPIQAPQRRVVAEEDECPICSAELPPKGPNGETSDRERHVDECIRSHSFGAPTPPQPQQAEAAVQPTGAGPASPVPAQPSGSRPRRMTGGRMLKYMATEKDCSGEDGLNQECVICLEDFEVGDEMGRLECLCKFHKVRFPHSLILDVFADEPCRNAFVVGGRRRERDLARHISSMNNDLVLGHLVHYFMSYCCGLLSLTT